MPKIETLPANYNPLVNLGAPECYTEELDIAGKNGVELLNMDDEHFVDYFKRGYPISMANVNQLVIATLLREFSSPADEMEIINIIGYIRAFGKYIRIISSEKETLAKADPLDICVVCVENQGRSQIEERVIQEFAKCFGLKVNLRSRGDRATPAKYDGKPSPVLRNRMRELGLPIDEGTVDQFTEADVNINTFLLVMDDSIELKEWAYRARYVLRRHTNDPFPGSKIASEGDVLDSLILHNTMFALTIVMAMTGSIVDKEWKNFNRKYRNIIESKRKHTTRR